MFGASNPFGQSSGSPFGSQTPFGQTNNAANNPFAAKPFGSTSPFGSPQTGSSIFGGTATGMFGAPQNSAAFPSTTTFGSSSSPAFGASSAPSFGSSSAPFGGSSVFGQKPTFGGFVSTSQANPFGSTSQPSQPAFGSSVFGSTTPFGASSQPAFGSTSTPSFGSTSMSAFGSTSTPAFGSSSTPSFGTSSTPAFGAGSAPAFGAPSTPAFGATSTPAFGSTTSPAFGSTGSAFGVSCTPVFGSGGAFGSSSTTPFGASSTPAFSFGSSPGFGQSASAIGSSPFASTPPSFGAQTSSFGAQATTPTFGSSGFGQQSFGARGGSRATPYAATAETETVGGQPVKLESISAMPAYKEKSHEELRWEDYQLGDKGGQSSTGQSLGGIGFGASMVQPNPFSSSTFTQTSASPFSTNTSTNLFGSKPSAFGPSTTPAFSASTFSSSPNLFQSTSTSSSLFGAPSSSQPLFGGSSASTAFGSAPSLFASTGQGNVSSFASGLNFGNTQASPFQSTTFGMGGSSFATSSIGLTSTFNQPNPFGNPPSAGFTTPNLFSSTPSNVSSTNFGMFGQTNPSQSMPFQLLQPSQTSGAFNFSNTGQTQAGGSSFFTGTSNMLPQNNFGHWPTTSSTIAVQPVSITNPFGTLPAMPQISIGQSGTMPSVQYGISSMPVVDKPAPARISSLLTSRHLSQRIRLPARKYHPMHDGPKVPFFSEEEETLNTPKADAFFIPRENPRALVIRPMDQQPSRTSVDKTSPWKDLSSSTPVHENGQVSEPVNGSLLRSLSSGDKNKHTVEDGAMRDQVHVKVNQKSNGDHDDHLLQKEESYMTLSGHRAGEAAIVYEHGADIEALMPKLRRSDYYTEPRVQELAAKERADSGFCRRVKDFVVGRHGYGSIKFLGETDVRRLDLESLVQFNNREVIVYMDDSKKPPVGQGLNKPAEVTLLNIKCFDRKSGRQYTEGPKIEKYKEMLKRKAEDQGAEFVSYDPVKGEWKFRVNHFSMYKLDDEEEDALDIDGDGGC